MLDLLKNRRSMRKLKDQKVDKSVVDLLVKAALLSPTGKNIKPWEFVVIDDAKVLNDLAVSKKHGAKFLTNTPNAIVVLSDETETDIWIEDASIACTVIHLMASSLGLGSCWIQIRNRKNAEDQLSEDVVRGLLGIPTHKRVEAIIGFGYPDEEKKSHDLEALDYSKVHHNRY